MQENYKWITQRESHSFEYRKYVFRKVRNLDSITIFEQVEIKIKAILQLKKIKIEFVTFNCTSSKIHLLLLGKN